MVRGLLWTMFRETGHAVRGADDAVGGTGEACVFLKVTVGKRVAEGGCPLPSPEENIGKDGKIGPSAIPSLPTLVLRTDFLHKEQSKAGDFDLHFLSPTGALVRADKVPRSFL